MDRELAGDPGTRAHSLPWHRWLFWCAGQRGFVCGAQTCCRLAVAGVAHRCSRGWLLDVPGGLLAIAGIVYGVVVGRDRLLRASDFVVEPLAGPDPVKPPAVPFELLLAEPVPIAGALRGVVGRAVAFDREHVSAWVEWVLDGEVDPIAGGPVLGGQLQPVPGEGVADVDFEGVDQVGAT